MDIVFISSLAASFIAGMIALFAPCCVTVLLPAYLGAALRSRTHVLKMTLVYFAGVSAVLVPIGMGAAWLAGLLRDYHETLYISGGVFMIVLAVAALFGKKLFVLPVPKALKSSAGSLSSASVFGLGVLSGAATSCCAPVLAGAVTLAVLSGAFWKGLAVTFAYVLGLTAPLFIAGALYERFNLAEAKLIRGKMIPFSLAGKNITVHSTNLAAAAVFALMGTLLIWLALSGNEFWAPAYQAALYEKLSEAVWRAFALPGVPAAVVVLMAGGIALLVYLSWRKR